MIAVIVDEYGYIKMPVTQDMLARAAVNERANYMRFRDLNTHLDHSKNRMTGFIGQEGVHVAFPMFKPSADVHSDFTYLNRSFDVKATAQNVDPVPEHTAGLIVDKKLKADWFIFVRVLTNREKLWIVGFIRREDYIDQATFVPEGEYSIGYTGKANFKVRGGDRWELPLSALVKPVSVLQAIQKVK